MKKIAMLAVLLFSVIGSTFAQEEESYAPKFKRSVFNHAALNVGAGTEGISVGVAAPLTNFFEFEAGVNVMPGFKINGDLNIEAQDVAVSYQGYNTTVHIPETTVEAKGNFSRTTFNIKANVYPFGGNSKFFVAAGLSFGGKKIAKVSGSSPQLKEYIETNYPQFKEQILNEIGANLGGYNVKLDDSYSIDGDVRCNNVRPYLGLGFGRLVPKNRIGFRFELGCQFMGKLKVYQNDNELDIDKILKDADADDDISKFVDNWKFYPVLKFSLVGRIL